MVEVAFVNGRFMPLEEAVMAARMVEMGHVKIEDLMSKQVMTTTRSQTIGHVRKVMSDNGVHALPVMAWKRPFSR